MNDEKMIGKNIKCARLEKGLSQRKLANECGFSDTTLSGYENGRKIPNLITIAKIAQHLNVSIDRLYYGDEDNAFIDAVPDNGRKIVNAIYYLWSIGVIEYSEYPFSDISMSEYYNQGEPAGMFLLLRKFHKPIKRLLISLNEFQLNKETYQDGEKYLEMLLASVATEINNEIKCEEQIELERRKRMEKEYSHYFKE